MSEEDREGPDSGGSHEGSRGGGTSPGSGAPVEDGDALPGGEDAYVIVPDGPAIPRAELTYRASRSGGPGGQHVNTSSTRVELTWDVAGSPSLTEDQRRRLRDALANRLDGAGVLHLTEGGSRSQHRNREAVTERLRELLTEALRPRKRRKPTRPSRAAREARLRAKRRRAETKRRRGPPREDE